MRRLYPDVADEALDDVYATLWDDVTQEAHVALGMVSSVDGGASLEGRTARLGGAADRVAFGRLREACDVILVGAGTVRAEDYRPPVGDPGRRRRRLARGRRETPVLAILSGSLDLDPDAAVFGDADRPPLVLTSRRAAETAPARLTDRAELVVVGEHGIDAADVVDELARRGHRRVLCEGGPSLAGQLLAADRLDELLLTLTPVALAGPAPRLAATDHEVPRDLELAELREHDGELLLRYRRRRPSDGRKAPRA